MNPTAGMSDDAPRQLANKIRLGMVHTVAGKRVQVKIWGTSDKKWYVLLSLIAVPVAIFVEICGFFSTRIRNENIRTLFVFTMAASPIFSFGVDRTIANKISQGKEFNYVISEVGDLGANSPVPAESRLHFLGHAGDYIFFAWTLND